MTYCYHGTDEPHLMVEVEGGECCLEAGATLLWHGAPITDNDLTRATPGEDDPAE